MFLVAVMFVPVLVFYPCDFYVKGCFYVQIIMSGLYIIGVLAQLIAYNWARFILLCFVIQIISDGLPYIHHDCMLNLSHCIVVLWHLEKFFFIGLIVMLC